MRELKAKTVGNGIEVKRESEYRRGKGTVEERESKERR